jgi:hypothetical protein
LLLIVRGPYHHPVILALLAGAVAFSGCASKEQPPAAPAAETTRNLGGDWSLKSFTPEKPLEQPYQALLDAQLKALTVSFRGDQYFAAGPGVNLQGRYVVTSAIGTTFQMTLFDPDGVAYPVAGRFRGAELDFQSQNERWRGAGVLARKAP